MTNTLNKFTTLDAIETKLIEDAQITPDGLHVAFVVADRYKLDTKRPNASIWLVSTSGGDARPFTAGPRRDYYPRWSPDSRRLAFLSDRIENGRFQIFVLERGGGEAIQLTQIEGSIEEMCWSGDSRSIHFLMEDPLSAGEKHRLDAKDDVIEFEQHPKYWRVYSVDVATKTIQQLTQGDWHAWEFAVSADGKRLAVVGADTPFEWSWYQSRISVVDIETGKDTVMHQSRRQLARPLFSPDNHTVAFLSSTWSDRGVTSGDLYIVPWNGGEARNLTRGYEGSISWMVWNENGHQLLALSTEGTDCLLSEIDVLSGRMKRLWAGAIGVASPNQPVFSYSAARQSFALVRESATEPRDVWLAARRGVLMEWKRLTNCFQEAASFEPVGVESIQWKAKDGLMIQGFVLKPFGYEAGKRYPMVTVVHGGPTSAYQWAYPHLNRWSGLLAAAGLVVFLPNPRGSTGRGVKFAEANSGEMGGKDFDDIVAGVDACIASGFADPQRLGLGGWSYGGFMTMWAVSQTDRFKAAMAGAGIANWKSFHGLTKYPTFDTTFYAGADAYDTDREAPYMWYSALTHVKRIKTPTLIVHGEQDLDVPVGQAYEFYRALKDHGVETQLAVYPREPHGFSERAHIIDLWDRIVKWFMERL
jgi:dipeptidyl aminopeptidase/acylaminoacyl peptidase